MITGNERGKADSKALTTANWNWQREGQPVLLEGCYRVQRTHGNPTTWVTSALKQ